MTINNYLYILQSEAKDTYYIGSSDDPERRVGYHNSENKGNTQKFRPWKIAMTVEFDSKEKALVAERKVKARRARK